VWRRQTLSSLLHYHASVRPDALALVDEHRRVTFGEYADEVAAIAARLGELGVKRDDRVAIWMSGRVEFPLVRLALARLGAVSVILSSGLGIRDFVAALQQARCAAILTTEYLRRRETAPMIAAAQDECPDLELAVAVDAESFTSSVSNAPASPSAEHRADEIDDIVFTSGTTGTPRGVLSCQARWLTVCGSQRRAGGFGPADVGLVLAPSGGTIGYLKTVFLPLLSGARTVLTEQPAASTQIELALREGASYLVAVPTQLIGLLGELDESTSVPLRVVFYGGAAMPAHAAQRLVERTGCFLLTSIGSTEAGTPGGTQLGDSLRVQAETVGSAYPGSHIAVRDQDGRELPPGELGALYSTGATIFDGYLDDPEATARCFEHGWIRHGDLAFIDEGGYVHYAGRADDVINRGGVKVAPVEVEAVLMRHPLVLEAAVAGVPDERLGERVCAFVRARPGASLTLEELRAFVATSGAGHAMQPERLVFVQSLPLSPGGKVDRNALRAHVRTIVSGGTG
jgi:acyl-coenzyme A synthetase/AMP-(fatty) acid ligase